MLNSNLDFHEKNSIRCFTNGVVNIMKKEENEKVLSEMQYVCDLFCSTFEVDSIKKLNSKQAMQLNVEVQKCSWNHKNFLNSLEEIKNPTTNTPLTAEFVRSFGSLD